ncbi:MAG: HEAT repeat domain-containing protein [Flavobacteriaceae bacterium]|nr:HEAT repeat domain-containing protein [Flavobacteriaceae bacterium]
MKCEKIQDQMADFLDQNLTHEEMNFVKKHIEYCDDCAKEHSEMKKLFFDLSEENLEQPSPSLRLNFEEMLAAEKKKQETPVIQLRERTSWKSYIRVAASILIVVSAFLIGKFTDGNENGLETDPQISKILAQMESQSASQRIAAFDLSEKIKTIDTKIIQALINRLLYDKNTSVRLAAVEALTRFSSLEMVKKALMKSLETDVDPAIQIELIQVLAKIQEKRALPLMKKLLDNEDVPEYVKKEVQINMPTIG